MPFIDVKVNCPLPAEKEAVLKAELGKAIALIPGKSEAVTMMNFTENSHLWYGGKNDDVLALVNVMVLRASPQEAYKAFSDAVIPLFQKELGAKQVYLKYEESQTWFSI